MNIFIFFIFSNIVASDSALIKNRFNHLFEPNKRCIVQMFNFFKNFGKSYLPTAWKDFDDKFFNFDKLNCSWQVIEYQANGLPDENGTYDGAIGMIQKNKQDIGLIFVRPDSLPYEPGKLTPTLVPADEVILSHRNGSKKAVYELTHFFDLDSCIYIYFFSCLFFIFTGLYVFVENFFIKCCYMEDTFLNSSCATWYKIFFLMVDQEQFYPKSVSAMILALFASIFCFFSIHGILLNTISSDLVVNVNPPTIESLDDLLASSLQPVIIKKLFLYQLLKASPEGSKLEKLWLRTGATGTGIFDVEISNAAESVPSMYELLEGLDNSTIALIVPEIFMRMNFKPFMCMNFEKVSVNLNQGEESFAPGILTGLMSHKIHPYVDKVWRYIFTTIFETQFYIGAIAQTMTNFRGLTFGDIKKYNSKVIQCIEKKKEDQQSGVVFNPLKLENLETLVKLYFFVSLLALIPFLFSLIINERTLKNFYQLAIIKYQFGLRFFIRVQKLPNKSKRIHGHEVCDKRIVVSASKARKQSRKPRRSI